MASRRNRGLWAGLGLAAGAGIGVLQAQHRREIARWRQQWQAGKPGLALITGASSGIGEVYARRLAERGFDLILVARRAEKLEDLAEEFRSHAGVHVEVLPADLAEEQGIAKVEARLAQEDVAFLVNNAGFGIPGAFVDIPVEQMKAMISVHVLASVRFTKAALPAMIERSRGVVVNVSSTAAFYAFPGDATYGPTKAYLNNFTESLSLSLAGSGVRLQALCPGFTVTGFHSTESYSETDVRGKLPDFLWQRSGFVVDESLHCLESDQVICVPGRLYRFLALTGRTGIAQIFINLVSRIDPGLILRLRGWNQ